jgi:hypothetical protein
MNKSPEEWPRMKLTGVEWEKLHCIAVPREMAFKTRSTTGTDEHESAAKKEAGNDKLKL